MDRIAYVVWTFPVLSQTFVVEELEAVGELGWRPLIVARKHPDEPEVMDPRSEKLLGRARWLEDGRSWDRVRTVLGTVARHPIAAALCAGVAVGSRSRWSVRNLWWGFLLAGLIRREGLSMLHVHFADDAGDIAYFASRVEGVPYVLTVHAVDIYMGRFLCRKLREAALIVTVCRYNVDQMRSRCPESLEAAPGGTLIKYAGVDTSRFRLRVPRPLRPAEEILAVGRLVEKKGFAVLVDAVAQLVLEGRSVRCRIVGDGPLRGQLLDRIAQRRLEGTVEILGARSPDELVDLYTAADVLAAPCTIAPWQDRDSMPVVLKEAMAMELPVVATDDFGIPEVVEPGTGILVPRDDPIGLAAGLAWVLDQPPEARAEMGRAGRRVVEQRFQEREGAKLLATRWKQVLITG